MWDVWSAKYGETRGAKADFLLGWAAWEFDAMNLAIEAIKQAWPLPDDLQAARDAINNALENKIVNFEQILGTRTITPTEHIGFVSTESPIFLTVKDGKVQVFQK
jgi:ABC-type branched-subunit amino acid transport system substrate-binding protein